MHLRVTASIPAGTHVTYLGRSCLYQGKTPNGIHVLEPKRGSVIHLTDEEFVEVCDRGELRKERP